MRTGFARIEPDQGCKNCGGVGDMNVVFRDWWAPEPSWCECCEDNAKWWTDAPVHTNPAHHAAIRARHFRDASYRLHNHDWPDGAGDRAVDWWFMEDAYRRALDNALGLR